MRSLCYFRYFAGKYWVDQLDLAEVAINGSENSATGLAPFFSNYAWESRVMSLSHAETPTRTMQMVPLHDVQKRDAHGDSTGTTRGTKK